MIPIALCLVTACAATANAGWPEFRGPFGDGTVPAATSDGQQRSLPLQWSESENVAWKTELPGKAWSTPVVMDGRVWLSNATEDGSDMSAICLDLETGEVVHDKHLFHNETVEPLGNHVNSYGSPSPAIEPGRVYIHFGSYGTACLDSETAEVIWERRDLPARHYRGPGSSVILWKDLLILTMDGIDYQYLVALDKGTGETVWKTDRTTEWDDLGPDGKPIDEGDLRKAYTTPLIVKVGDDEQLVSTGAKSTFGYNPATGEELWQVTYRGFSNASRPVAGDGMVFINSGYGKPDLIAVRLDPKARGDITASHVKWVQSKRAPLRSSPVFAAGHIFMVNDGGVATCLDADDGEEIWSERLSGQFSASPIVFGDRIYCFNESGESFVFEAARKFRLIAENKLNDGMMASPAVAGNRLILRTTKAVYCIADQ